jgi:hypothetical protein
MSYELEIYRLDVTDGSFTRAAKINTFENLSFFNRLNGVGSCVFNLAIQNPKATRENLLRYRNQVVIKRDGIIVWFGPIIRITTQYAGVQGVITVQANTYLEHFRSRYTAKLKNYTDEEQCDIAWDLIDTVQSRTNGELGITEGSTPSSNSRDRTYEYAEVAQALINLSNIIGGFDFEFAASTDSNNLLDSITFNCYYPTLGTERDNVPKLRVGRNIQSFTSRTDSKLHNTGTAEGAGTGSPIISTSTNSGSQTGFTRREAIKTWKSISVPDTLDDRIDTYITREAAERQVVGATLKGDKSPTIDQYGLGDTLFLDMQKGEYVDWELKGRVVELAVDVDRDGVETVTPKFEIYR